MQTYWIVRENGKVVAALAERFYSDTPEELLTDLKDFAKTGPIERITTDQPVIIGGSLDK